MPKNSAGERGVADLAERPAVEEEARGLARQLDAGDAVAGGRRRERSASSAASQRSACGVADARRACRISLERALGDRLAVSVRAYSSSSASGAIATASSIAKVRRRPTAGRRRHAGRRRSQPAAAAAVERLRQRARAALRRRRRQRLRERPATGAEQARRSAPTLRQRGISARASNAAIAPPVQRAGARIQVVAAA